MLYTKFDFNQNSFISSFLCREQRCKLNTASGVYHHLVLIQQDQGPAHGQTRHDHATLPDHKV